MSNGRRSPNPPHLGHGWMLATLSAMLLLGAVGAVSQTSAPTQHGNTPASPGSTPSRQEEENRKLPVILDRLEGFYSAAETLRTRFEIETVNELVGDVEVERGELFLTRPIQMRWQYSEPKGKMILLDGHFQWLYLPSEKQVFRGGQQETASGLTLTLLSNPASLQEEFNIRLVDGPEDPKSVELQLSPREANSDIQQLILKIERAKGFLMEIRMTDELNKLTVIRLSAPKINTRISSKTYRFQPPRGTEMLDFNGDPIVD